MANRILQSECLIIDRILLTPDGRTLIWSDGGFYKCMECKKIKPKHSVKAYSETPNLRIDGEHLCPGKNFFLEKARLEEEEAAAKERGKERKRQSSSGDNNDSQRPLQKKRRRLLSPIPEAASTFSAAVSTTTLNPDAAFPVDDIASEFPQPSRSLLAPPPRPIQNRTFSHENINKVRHILLNPIKNDKSDDDVIQIIEENENQENNTVMLDIPCSSQTTFPQKSKAPLPTQYYQQYHGYHEPDSNNITEGAGNDYDEHADDETGYQALSTEPEYLTELNYRISTCP